MTNFESFSNASHDLHQPTQFPKWGPLSSWYTFVRWLTGTSGVVWDSGRLRILWKQTWLISNIYLLLDMVAQIHMPVQVDARAIDSIPGWGRSLGVGNGNPLQYSCLENSMDTRSLAGYSPWGCRELDMTAPHLPPPPYVSIAEELQLSDSRKPVLQVTLNGRIWTHSVGGRLPRWPSG